MVGTVDALFGLLVLVGLVLCGLGYSSARRWDQLGVGSLAAFAALLGLAGVTSGAVGVVGETVPDEPIMPLWTQVAFLFWGLAAVPWALFALQYTGRYTRVRARTVVGLYLPFTLMGAILAVNVVDLAGALPVVDVLSSLLAFYCLALTLLGSLLLAQAARSYVHLPFRHGTSLAATPIVVFVAINSTGVIAQVSELTAVVLHLLGLTVATLLFATALTRGDVLASTPAVETVGERAVTRETDDLVFVVDGDDRVVKYNETAAGTLALPGDVLLGRPLGDVLGHGSDELAVLETVTLETEAGRRRYDPQVSPITDDRGTELGAVLGLRDVTERELREQRLAVLNRVLRHNLRNKVEVVKSHAEALDGGRPGEDGDGHAWTIAETADAIAELGESARTIDRFVSNPAATEVDLVDAVEDVLDAVGADETSVAVSLDVPDPATVETNRDALAAALESALENALEYADSAVSVSLEPAPDPQLDGYAVAIADDGPGVPEDELDSLDLGRETALQHGTGLGLWQLKWAVTTMGGDLEFETNEGTTVTFTVPDQRQSGADDLLDTSR